MSLARAACADEMRSHVHHPRKDLQLQVVSWLDLRLTRLLRSACSGPMVQGSIFHVLSYLYLLLSEGFVQVGRHQAARNWIL